MKTDKPEGICKLTGAKGPFVKSHIIPQALSKPDIRGRPFTQSGRDYAPQKRRDSWYDARMVTRAGEDILARYDDWAIAELRLHRLVWSGWGEDEELRADEMSLIPGAGGMGARKIKDIDARMLRLFLLSILWRAAATTLPEFRELRLLPQDRKRLARMLCDGRVEPMSFYPAMLFQLSTRGQFHNHTPIAQRKPRNIQKPEAGTIPIYRFYFDGLIIHFHRKERAKDVRAMGPMMVGGGKDLIVGLRPFEGSWQQENLVDLITEAQDRWPDRLAKISRS